MIHPFLVSTGIVALAEMGDKTQLLALLLTTQFRRPVPIILGMLVATVVNHAFAGALGSWLAALVNPTILRWMLGLSFLAMAVWTLIPDKLDDDQPARSHFGVFTATVVAFFLAEMGDKTQLATVALAAQYQSLLWVVAGSTAGMNRRSAHGWSGVMLGANNTHTAVPKQTRYVGAHARRRPAICS